MAVILEGTGDMEQTVRNEEYIMHGFVVIGDEEIDVCVDMDEYESADPETRDDPTFWYEQLAINPNVGIVE